MVYSLSDRMSETTGGLSSIGGFTPPSMDLLNLLGLLIAFDPFSWIGAFRCCPLFFSRCFKSGGISEPFFSRRYFLRMTLVLGSSGLAGAPRVSFLPALLLPCCCAR